MSNDNKMVNELDLFEMSRIVLNSRKLILGIVALSALAALIYSILTPQIWKSDATFYAESSKNTEFSLSMLAVGKLGKELLDQAQQSEAAACVTIMQSRSFSEEVIRRFDLISHFKLTKPDSLANMDEALVKLKKVVQTGYGQRNNLIYVEVETKSKQLSSDIAQFYVSRLEDYLQHERNVKGRRNRIFLESRVDELWKSIDSMQVAISEFKTTNKAVDLKQQTSQLVNQYSNLVANKMKLEISLELAKASYSPNSPVIKDIELQMANTTRQIAELEKADNSSAPRFQLDLAGIPSLTARMEMMQLNLAVLQQVFDYVRPQYEKAKLEEQRNTPQLEILDSPRQAGKRVKPRRALICIIAVIMSAFMSVIFVLLKEIVVSQPERIQELKDTLNAK